MKTLTEVNVKRNGNWYEHDCMIEYFVKPDRIPDEPTKIVWHDKEKGIAKCHGEPRTVTLLLKGNDDIDKIEAVHLSPASIKKLYSLIIEIEKTESNEFID